MSVESYCLDVGGEMTEISNQAMVDNITDYYSSLLGNSVESWVKLEDKVRELHRQKLTNSIL